MADGPLSMDLLSNPRTLAHLVAVITDGAGGALPDDPVLEGCGYNDVIIKVLEDCCTHLKLPTSLHGLLLPALTTGDLDLLPSLIAWMFGRALQSMGSKHPADGVHQFKPGNKYS